MQHRDVSLSDVHHQGLSDFVFWPPGGAVRLHHDLPLEPLGERVERSVQLRPAGQVPKVRERQPRAVIVELRLRLELTAAQRHQVVADQRECPGGRVLLGDPWNGAGRDQRVLIGMPNTQKGV